jgi:hypothetical protein
VRARAARAARVRWKAWGRPESAKTMLELIKPTRH